MEAVVAGRRPSSRLDRGPYTLAMTEAAQSARRAAALAVAQAASLFPDVPPIPLQVEGLSPADRALATAIHRTTLQRWLTLEHLLGRFARQPLPKMESAMRGVLLTGAAQLLFMPGVADYAAVDESVTLAGKLVRPQARAMANAILRKAAGLVAGVESDRPWSPARDALPFGGGTLRLTTPALPHPANLVKHLPAATGMPEPVVGRWVKTLGPAVATRLCLHALQEPPTVVVVEPGFDRAAPSEHHQPHEDPQSIVWTGPHAALVEFLAGDPARRVQDPASRAAASAADGLTPKVILDYCAGLGTKTRQLALAHPSARVVATDVNEARLATLRELPARYPNVEVVEPEAAPAVRCDLLLLDVPCSNVGVLARRPEARFRFNRETVAELSALQRQLLDTMRNTVNRGGHVLYATCSIDREENQDQAAGFARRAGATLLDQHLILPAGTGASYHDGSYRALMRV
jgi:16S rRNA (cytosine967-C5)-methyltransferase